MKLVLVSGMMALAACAVPGAAPDCEAGKFLTRRAGQWTCEKPEGSDGSGLTKTQADDAYRAKGDVPITDLAKTGCAAGQVLKFEDNTWKCAADAVGTSTTYTAGAGLALTGSEFSVDATVAKKSELDAVSVTASAALTKPAADALYRPAGTVEWSDVASVPSALGAAASLNPCGSGQFVRRTSAGWECAAAGGVTFNSLGSLEGLLNLPAGNGLGTSMSKSQADVANGSCISIPHGWNTNAVGYAAWMTDRAGTGAKWVPVQPGYQAPLATLSAAAVAASPGNSLSTASNVVDGNATTSWNSSTSSTTPAIFVELEFSQVVGLARVEVQAQEVTGTYGVSQWHIDTSPDGTAFQTQSPALSCTPGTECRTFVGFSFPLGTFARRVRIVPTACLAPNCSLAEVRAFSVNTYTVSQPDANTLSFCNYTGEARSMALRIWR